MPLASSRPTPALLARCLQAGLSLLVIVAASRVNSAAAANDWPQWQGPDRNAKSQEVGLLQEWPEGGPPLAWRIDGLGGGHSAPSLADGQLYGMSHRGDQEVVWALAEADGQELWVRPLGPAVQQQFPQSKEGPGCTPTVDGDRLYVLGLGGTLACLRVADGEIVWQRNLASDFGGVAPMWNFRESPLVDGDKVICTPGADDALLVALDKLTGDVIWKTKSPSADAAADAPAAEPPAPRRGRGGGGGFFGGPGSGAGYSSIIAIDFEGQRQYVQLTARALIGVAADDGRQLWEYAKPANRMGINCTTPLYHDGLVFASSAYGAGGGVVKLTKDAAGGIDAEEVFFTNRLQNHHGGVILLDGALYGANGGNGGGNLICIDFATGDVLWDQRREEPRVPKGSIAYADGRLYYRTEDGAILLIEPSRERYIERGRFEQPDRTNVPAWAHPVIAGGKLFIRDQDALFCYDVSAK
jgi:outer membrane protein assembly factor BamB